MQNLDKIIRTVEEKWLEKMFTACAMQFSNVHLPSHDEFHHRRVWEHAKQLVQQATKQGVAISETDIERLMIAVFFHDQGMSVTLSKEHGTISRQICKAYFKDSPFADTASFDSILEAVEDHDKKDYGTTSYSKQFDLHQYLNIADDLDAFGIIGAYRYLEIYILRNTNLKRLAEIIQENLESRFRHFSEMFELHSPFVTGQHSRYLVTHNYFKELNVQLKQMDFSSAIHFGPVGVMNYIKDELINHKKEILTVCEEVNSSNKDVYCKHFFERLKKEV